MSWYYTLKYTDFENKTAEIDVEALVQKFLVRILLSMRYIIIIILYNYYVTLAINITDGYGFSNNAHHELLLKKKVMLYLPLISVNPFNQLYITKRFSFKKWACHAGCEDWPIALYYF